MSNNYKYLSLLAVCNKEFRSNNLLKKLERFYFKITVVEDEFEAINAYERFKFNIVLICDGVNNLAIETVVNFIRRTKKKQVILLFNSNEKTEKYDVTQIINKSTNYISLIKSLFTYNKYVIQRNKIREEILKNRLLLCMNNRSNDFSFVYELNENISEKALMWSNICANCFDINKKFEDYVNRFENKNTFTYDDMKDFSKILNRYYQVFNMIEDTKDLSFLLLKHAGYFHSLNMNHNLKNKCLINMIRYIYIEILYFQYILFLKNELKNINYFKTCLINSFELFDYKAS